MERRLLLFIVLFQHSVTTENSDGKISIFAHEMDEAILPLREHLLHQIELVIWNKGEERIATYYGNDSLHYVDPGYREILNISHDGSLILKARSWKAGEEYSARIRLNDNSQSSMYYRVKVHNVKFISHDMGPKIVYAAVGEELILPWEADIDKSEIEEIDWLTDKWDYFAVTKVGGDIRILEDDYAECLASTRNGSLIFKKVTKSHQGNYRACIFSNNGKIVERNYQVHIHDHEYMQKYMDRPSENTFRLDFFLREFVLLASFCTSFIFCCIILFHLRRSKRMAYECSSTQGKNHEPSPSPEEDKMCPQEENHETKKSHDAHV